MSGTSSALLASAQRSARANAPSEPPKRTRRACNTALSGMSANASRSPDSIGCRYDAAVSNPVSPVLSDGKVSADSEGAKSTAADSAAEEAASQAGWVELEVADTLAVSSRADGKSDNSMDTLPAWLAVELEDEKAADSTASESPGMS